MGGPISSHPSHAPVEGPESTGYEAGCHVDNLESEHRVVTYDNQLIYHILSPPTPTSDIWASCPVKIIYRGLRVS
jgi:hypothetical protein